MNMKVPNSQGNYAPPMTIRYGPESVPDSLNPIFSSWLFDFECMDRMFTYWDNGAPYNLGLGKTPVGGVTPWMAYDWSFQVSNFTTGGGYQNLEQAYAPNGADGVTYVDCANCTYYFRHDIKWSDGQPFTVDDFNESIFLQDAFSNSWTWSDQENTVNFVKINNYTCSVYYDVPSFYALYFSGEFEIVPKHLYQYISFNVTDAQAGSVTTTSLNGVWPGQDATPDEYIPNPYFTYAQLTSADGGQYMWVGTNMWEYVPGTFNDAVGGGMVFKPNPYFWMNITQGEMDFYYTWNSGTAPQGGAFNVGLADLVILANAYGTSGTMTTVPFKLGGRGVWEPGCVIAPPGGKVGLSDLVTLALNYGKSWGGVDAQGNPTT
jgi:ABC-type transport system substrate-binding protein